MYVAVVLKLRTALQAQSFEAFARDRWLPSLDTRPTRIGQLNNARLLRRHRAVESEPIDTDNEFLLISEWDGPAGFLDLPRSKDDSLAMAFEAFDVKVTPIGRFETVAELAEGAV